MSIWFQCAWMWTPNMPPQSSIWTAVSRIHPRMIKTPEAEKTGKCLSRNNLSDWSKKLQHWSYRICSRIGHSPFLKESCRVLSYKSKIDLTGAHRRWILKMKVRSTFFHRFSAFSNICCYQFLFVLAPFWIFHSESTWRWSPRRPNLKIISTSSEASNFCTSVVHVGTDRIGSCSKQVTFSWQFGFRKSINAVLPYYILSAFLHAPVFPFGSHFQEPIQRRIIQESF